MLKFTKLLWNFPTDTILYWETWDYIIGGQRQRIFLARAISGNSEVLILDEATSALDLETERRVQANVDRLREGMTTIIITHQLSKMDNISYFIYIKNIKQVNWTSFYKKLSEVVCYGEYRKL
ncbi:ATP-binding cassette domain-containing protein [Paenibacillus paeoniae]|uniref:ATP-binding cassette domain-containing protein n=1 Tax=Paenibacillus paeoniae TaxID=2292705 RepID=A0A371P822_9BACL|nr:ATP-binding cassette domain-containing protein [Paenibacillus paeoniae]